MHPKDRFYSDPGFRHAVIYKDTEELELEKLVKLVREMGEQDKRPPSEDFMRQQRMKAAADHCARLKVEDLDQDAQVDLYNRLVEVMAAK